MIVLTEGKEPPMSAGASFRSELRFRVEVMPDGVISTVHRTDSEEGGEIRTFEYGLSCEDSEDYLTMLGQAVLMAYSDIVDAVFVHLGVDGPNDKPYSGFPQ